MQEQTFSFSRNNVSRCQVGWQVLKKYQCLSVYLLKKINWSFGVKSTSLGPRFSRFSKNLWADCGSEKILEQFFVCLPFTVICVRKGRTFSFQAKQNASVKHSFVLSQCCQLAPVHPEFWLTLGPALDSFHAGRALARKSFFWGGGVRSESKWNLSFGFQALKGVLQLGLKPLFGERLKLWRSPPRRKSSLHVRERGRSRGWLDRLVDRFCVVKVSIFSPVRSGAAQRPLWRCHNNYHSSPWIQ